MIDAKIKSRPGLLKALARLHRANKRIVFTNGCFDIIHCGHVKYLNRARRLGDILVVGLNGDSSVKAIKGDERPINREADRATVLASLYFVDLITIFDEPTPEELIRKVRPDVLVKGGDWKADDIVGAGFVKSYGGRVVSLPFVKGYSTSSLVEKIARL